MKHFFTQYSLQNTLNLVQKKSLKALRIVTFTKATTTENDYGKGALNNDKIY